MNVDAVVAHVDRLQRRIPLVGFPLAVVRKYGEDAGARMAALLTYYGFLSSIPILLIVVWIATQLLRSSPQLRDDFIAAVVPQGMGEAVNSALAAMPTSPLPLVIGIVGLLFTGNGIVFTAYDIINQIQGVPHRERFGFFPRYLRALAALLVILLGIGLLGALAVTLSRVDLGGVEVVIGLAGSWLVIAAMLLAVVALLSARPGSWRAAWPGAVLGTVILEALLVLGGWALGLLVARSGAVYGPFAAVVGLFSLLYLVSQGMVFAAEIAVVRRKRLWPRGLVATDPTEADERSLQLRIGVEQRTEADRVVAGIESG